MKIDDLIEDTENYINDVVHSDCKYDIYVALINYIQSIESELGKLKASYEKDLDDVAKQSEYEFWKQLKYHFEPLD